MINRNNYISHIDRLDFENLPEELKQAHLVIMTKTDNGHNWKACDHDKELKELANLTFLKLGEFIASKGKEPLNGLDGNKKHTSGYKEEIMFFKRILALKGKNISKKELLKLIDDLQAAIVSRKIGKDSPFAAEINYLQEGLISVYNKKNEVKVLQVNLKPETVRKLEGAVKKSKRYEESIFPAAPPDKIEPVDLRGIENTEPETPVMKPEEPLQGIESKEPEVPGHIMNSVDFSKLKFDSIGLKGKWLKLIGDPAPGFSAMVFGRPKMGKSYLCVDFAGYLARNHGPVLYAAREEKLDSTLQKKLNEKDVAHPNLFVSDYLPEDLSPYKFVFIDSVNKLGLSPEDIEKLRNENKGISFIFVFQTTKEGNFRGANEFQHDVDVVIEVPEKGKAVQFGRYNQGGEMNIFEDTENRTVSLNGIAKKKKTTGKEISITAELGIPLEELAMELLEEKQDKSEIINVVYKQTEKVEKAVLEMAKNEIKERKLNISVERVMFRENDSDKVDTGAAYFEVILKGKIDDLKKVTGDDDIFVYDWDEALNGKKRNLHLRKKNAMLAGIKKSNMKKNTYPAWTRPTFLNKKDHDNLKKIYDLYSSGKLKEAMQFASGRDTVVRDQIPPEIWKEIGGELTNAGKDELRAEASKHKERKLNKYDNVPDDLNPRFIFGTTATKLLCEALNGDFDIMYVIRRELANRGVDKDGKLVGFPEAKKIHGI